MAPHTEPKPDDINWTPFLKNVKAIPLQMPVFEHFKLSYLNFCSIFSFSSCDILQDFSLAKPTTVYLIQPWVRILKLIFC